jgi:hypothetical protein
MVLCAALLMCHNTFDYIVKQPGEEPPPELSAQLALPLRHGGLGLQDTSVMAATVAFMSGAATAHVTLRGT